ncbi:MAG: alanine--tRNA ligase-related protein, partial [Candidatus Omnitrophica bacterium]|nr:alanine--tRNA ligase-related protein [Candidatus Omnitrophota bacterium]
MSKILADDLRDSFLNFFEAKNHKIMPPDSLVPKEDPTVLFTPAGMNQFKKEFLGIGNRALKRVATCQRCLRTDDLDKVGKTSGHHTFFEMLGNFSFGDYFKKEAILWSWEFLTKKLKIDKEKLWVSVYTEDVEAYEIWSRIINLPKERIVKLSDKENFWPSEAKTKGPNGPCGPCSEIFFDWGEDCGCKRPDCNPSCNCGRFVEVWNLVFTQFNRKDPGILEPLPQKNIDTGMGLERLTAIM